MFLKTDNIALRCADPDDAMQIYIWENDRSLWRVSGTYVPYSHYEIEQFLKNNNDLFSHQQLRLMIVHDEKTVGCIDIFEYDPVNERAGVGILIDDKYRHHAYAKEAVGLLVEYLFEDLMLKQVHCLVDSTNTDSQHLFRSLGFVQCGCRKQWLKTPDGFIDEYMYQLINERHV